MFSDLFFVGLSVAITFSGLLILGILPSRMSAGITASLVVLNALLTSVPALHVLLHQPLEVVFYGVGFLGDIPVRMDALSAWFILIVNFTCINGVWYGMGYMKPYSDQKANISLHWMMFLLFQSSMLWVCLVQNSLVFLIVWEIMSLSSFMLVLFEHQNKDTRQAGINYLVQMHIGVAFLTTAFIWAGSATGSFGFTAIGQFFSTHPNIWMFLLLFIGFGIKAGFIPLHSWLPHAHPAAPSHISAVMSGVIVKLGIYGILRMVSYVKQDYLIIGESVLILSVLTGIYGILNAAVHRDFKRMLAYCTIENIGIIGTGIGLGIIGMGAGNKILMFLGFGGALMHTLNHSLFKSLLFFSAGSVYQQTHTRDMEKLGGLWKKMPQSGFLFLMGALAIGGMPPFNGFISEFMLYSGCLEGIKSLQVANNLLMIFSLAGLALMGGLSILTFSKSFGTIFLGTPRTSLPNIPREVPFGMRAPQYLILGVMLSIGIFPGFWVSLLWGPLGVLLHINAMPETSGLVPVMDTLSRIGKYSLIFILLTGAVWLIRKSLTIGSPEHSGSTWGCGYAGPATRMQYTGKSYSKTLGKLLNFIIIEVKQYPEMDSSEIFPAKRSHSSHYIDYFEKNFFSGVTNQLLNFLNYFQFIQNGKAQVYVIYGILFMLLIFVGTLFHLI